MGTARTILQVYKRRDKKENVSGNGEGRVDDNVGLMKTIEAVMETSKGIVEFVTECTGGKLRLERGDAGIVGEKMNEYKGRKITECSKQEFTGVIGGARLS